jgi:hypothetical protein
MHSLVRVALLLFALGATACASFAPTVTDESRVAAVGRITDIDANHGFAIVEFPTGRMFVHFDKREIGRYIVGDDLRVDSFGRPLPPQPRSPRPSG